MHLHGLGHAETGGIHLVVKEVTEEGGETPSFSWGSPENEEAHEGDQPETVGPAPASSSRWPVIWQSPTPEPWLALNVMTTTFFAIGQIRVALHHSTGRFELDQDFLSEVDEAEYLLRLLQTATPSAWRELSRPSSLSSPPPPAPKTAVDHERMWGSIKRPGTRTSSAAADDGRLPRFSQSPPSTAATTRFADIMQKAYSKKRKRSSSPKPVDERDADDIFLSWIVYDDGRERSGPEVAKLLDQILCEGVDEVPELARIAALAQRLRSARWIAWRR